MSSDTACYLLVTSGDGPGECRIAVGHVLRRIESEARDLDLDIGIATVAGRIGPASATVSLHGAGAAALALRWLGTVRWIARSSIRPHHRRQNWFVGVFSLQDERPGNASFDAGDVRISTFRAGGPGGQHQNTTDSAVRAHHIPTGISVVARDQRSQHRNKAAALERLRTLLSLQQRHQRAQSQRAQNLLHKQLERGNPVRTFRGEKFAESD